MKSAELDWTGVSRRRTSVFGIIWKYRALYLLLLPALLYFIIFAYIPYFGLTIAFKDFSPGKGIWGSSWVGLKYFKELFTSDTFFQVLRNTLLISLYKLIFGFPMPILFALLLNEVRHAAFKKIIQTVTYFPHFLSWVVFGGIMLSFLTPAGVVPKLLQLLHVDGANLLTDNRFFRSILVVTHILKSFGWGAIIYLAALAGIDPALYEAARMDGAGRWKQILYVTLPGIRSVIVLMFILELGHILDAGFEQVFIMYNPVVYGVGDIIDTYVYRVGLGEAQYSVATAVGLFKGVIGFVLIYISNYAIKKLGEPTLW
ncbi:ABC transporter permease [Paenibacillus thalictri]|uniref:Sugar ABC transporter permease n=1 Tax=Paenibacillus thalictri TaxID=2527873 RepID=A0A4Q9DM84_9BACL|nr:ABC transporter permease subunit [Paenibacillus thalictri]TBL76352.1 sugar ABC transporter permease [Paenibacillus thalictri]